MQQYLAMPFEQIQKQTEIARHLPPPLYVLFVQANAYGQACGKQSQQWQPKTLQHRNIVVLLKTCSLAFVSDKNLNVSISGDVDEAKALSKPPDDSQGTIIAICDAVHTEYHH